MTFFIVTYGCQMNERDADAVHALLLRHGHAPARSEADADAIIVNTCSVRGKAEAKALGKLALLVYGKREAPGRLVGAMGCMVQRLKTELFVRVPGLDFAVGTHGLSRLPRILEQAREGQGAILCANEDGEALDSLTGHAEGQMSAFVNILLGCDRRCTYCVVPQVRGSEWSRPAPGIVEEVRGLVARGAKEVTLLGQSVTAYGRRHAVWPEEAAPRGFTEPFPRLLAALDRIAGLRRLRFTSGHPAECSAELVRAMAELPSVCEHLHMPCQSGSDRILKLMRRGYSTDDFRRAVERLRRAVPDAGITTDVIVGFPTETEQDFLATSRFTEEMGFDNAFIFKYSPRPGTPAAEMPDDVPAEEKMRRNKALLVEQDRRGLAINRALIGQRLDVLVEGVSLRDPDRWAGRTRTNKIAFFAPDAAVARGDLVDVRIERVRPQTLYGSLSEARAAGAL